MTFFSHSNDTHAATAFCAMQGNVDDILLAGQVGGVQPPYCIRKSLVFLRTLIRLPSP